MKLRPAHKTIVTHFSYFCNKMHTLGYLINKWGAHTLTHTFACDVIELGYSLCQLHILIWFVLVCLIHSFLFDLPMCIVDACMLLNGSNWAKLNWIEFVCYSVWERANDNFVTLRVLLWYAWENQTTLLFIVDAVRSCHRLCAQCYLQHTFA